VNTFGSLSTSTTLVTGSLIISSSKPASVSASGTPGTITYSAGAFYFCTGSSAWFKISGSRF
jgi:hypothetical protein